MTDVVEVPPVTSVVPGWNGDLILAAAQLGHLRADWLTFDATYGRGRFWTRWQPDRLVGGDIKPHKARDVCCDFTRLPFADRVFDAVVCDPPYRLSGRPDQGDFDDRYGIDQYRTWQARMDLCAAGIVECARVANRVLLIKCQDQVCSGKIHWQSREFADLAETVGFRLKDMLLLHTRARAQPGGRSQQHSRRPYSNLLVMVRDRPCETVLDRIRANRPPALW